MSEHPNDKYIPNEYVHRALAAEQHLAAAKVKIAALEAQLAEWNAEIRRLNMEMSVYRQGYTQKDAEAVLATIQALDELKQRPLPHPPKEPPEQRQSGFREGDQYL